MDTIINILSKIFEGYDFSLFKKIDLFKNDANKSLNSKSNEIESNETQKFRAKEKYNVYYVAQFTYIRFLSCKKNAKNVRDCRS